ncbi:sigma-70 family RNA polymerase sigma factor [uncultured Aquabacterium sp.]|nr:sigma-70 family RNA polymerase sigma factor [uncultured Aquabacterium sp.]
MPAPASLPMPGAARAPAPSAARPDPELMAQWARDWRGPMLRFAQLHLQPREEAEDAVQDALVAALGVSADQLQQADPRRYLFGILKHKITDRLRAKYRREARDVVCDEPDELDALLFDGHGHWVAEMAPTPWRTPEADLLTEQFFAVVDLCIDKLPSKAARVFSMKELLECDADEVCSTLGLSKADYWQNMSRARKQIQLCLSQTWFDGGRP